MIRAEDQLQRAVIELLGAAAVPGLWWFAVPNGGWRSPVEARILKGLGVRAGAPDMIFCIPPDGHFAGLELKAPRGRLSRVQEENAEGILGAGAGWACIKDIETAIKVLTEWGAIKPNRIRLLVVK